MFPSLPLKRLVKEKIDLEGSSVWVRSMTAKEYLSFASFKSEDFLDSIVHVLRTCLCNDEGQPLIITDEDEAILQGCSLEELTSLHEACIRASGLDSKKNSAPSD